MREKSGSREVAEMARRKSERRGDGGVVEQEEGKVEMVR